MKTSVPQTDGRPARRFQYLLGGLFLLITTATVIFSLLAWIAPHTGMGQMGPMMLLFLVAWAAFTVILSRAFAPKVWIRASISIVMFFAVYAMFAVAIKIMIARLHAHPPPRPMFHNFFGEHERVLLPFWHEGFPLLDAQGNLMWADYDDNVLVILLNAAPDGSWSGGPIADEAETRFPVGVGSQEQWVTVQRTSNSLIVIRQDGSQADFPIPPDAATSIYEKGQSQFSKSFPVDVGTLLDASDKHRLDAFVNDAGDRNPR